LKELRQYVTNLYWVLLRKLASMGLRRFRLPCCTLIPIGLNI
jgi:hypothetical protein